ncbi:MAG TPA: uroporphyrinogen-III synthase [Acidimicrobiales bacterium]|nr:uroporphyrinogen-III synthase [Acidimicrobiales bacterium]
MSDGPLDGFVVGVTADRRASEQAELLRRRGAEVMLGPSLETAYLASDEALRAATLALIEVPPDYLAATTGIGIRAWFEAAQVWGLGDALVAALGGTRIVARGPKAAGAVQAAGLTVWRSAANEHMDQLLAHLLGEPLAGARVAVQLYGRPVPEVVAGLSGAGAAVVEVPVYRWRTPDDPGPACRLAQAAVDGRLHAVTFTAAPAVANLFALAAGAGIAGALRDAFNRNAVVAACVGPVCARGASDAGIVAPLVPPVGRLGLMVRALSERLAGERRTIAMAGVDVVLQGLMAMVGQERVRLNSRERALLDALATRPGTVVSRPALVREMWPSNGVNPHAVEVAVARLRPRLGAAGAALVAVPGRGYRLEP